MRDDQKDNRVYFWHIQDAINRIERFTQDGREQFFQSELVQGAVVWNVVAIELPRLKAQVEVILEELGRGPDAEP